MFLSRDTRESAKGSPLFLRRRPQRRGDGPSPTSGDASYRHRVPRLTDSPGLGTRESAGRLGMSPCSPARDIAAAPMTHASTVGGGPGPCCCRRSSSQDPSRAAACPVSRSARRAAPRVSPTRPRSTGAALGAPASTLAFARRSARASKSARPLPRRGRRRARHASTVRTARTATLAGPRPRSTAGGAIPFVGSGRRAGARARRCDPPLSAHEELLDQLLRARRAPAPRAAESAEPHRCSRGLLARWRRTRSRGPRCHRRSRPPRRDAPRALDTAP